MQEKGRDVKEVQRELLDSVHPRSLRQMSCEHCWQSRGHAPGCPLNMEPEPEPESEEE